MIVAAALYFTRFAALLERFKGSLTSRRLNTAWLVATAALVVYNFLRSTDSLEANNQPCEAAFFPKPPAANLRQRFR